MTKFFLGILAVVLLLFGELNVVHAQFSAFNFGVNGLTCSQCTRSVEMQLRKLSFIDSIQVDLEKTTGRIVPKPNVKVRPSAIAQAIKDAGFSIRFLQATMATADVTAVALGCFTYQYNVYYLKDELLPTDATVWNFTFTDAEFLPQKTWFWQQKKDRKPPRNIACKGRDYYAIALQSN